MHVRSSIFEGTDRSDGPSVDIASALDQRRARFECDLDFLRRQSVVGPVMCAYPVGREQCQRHLRAGEHVGTGAPGAQSSVRDGARDALANDVIGQCHRSAGAQYVGRKITWTLHRHGGGHVWQFVLLSVHSAARPLVSRTPRNRLSLRDRTVPTRVTMHPLLGRL